MNNWETLRTALEAVRSHRLRSALTMLGILIGIAAVILTVGLGQGAQAKVRTSIDKLGSNLLIISPGSTTSSTGVRAGRGSVSTLSVTDAQMLASHQVAPDIAQVAPISTSSQVLLAGSNNWTTGVIGTTPAWLQVRARSLSQGRFFNAQDVTQANQVVVLGDTTAAQLFGSQKPLGRPVTISGSTFTVIGVLTPIGASPTTDQDDLALMPTTTYANRIAVASRRTTLSSIYIEAASSTVISAAYQEADTALLTLHGVTSANADFTIASQESLLTTATSVTRTLTILLGGVAGISLLVGGIGVMNIMLVSVTERVREIGLRKALGATPSAVRRQFLYEASALGFTGGLIGLALGVSGALFLPHVLNQPITINPYAAAGALAVSLVIGIVAGVYPASRAAKLAPIDALRND